MLQLILIAISAPSFPTSAFTATARTKRPERLNCGSTAIKERRKGVNLRSQSSLANLMNRKLLREFLARTQRRLCPLPKPTKKSHRRNLSFSSSGSKRARDMMIPGLTKTHSSTPPLRFSPRIGPSTLSTISFSPNLKRSPFRHHPILIPSPFFAD